MKPHGRTRKKKIHDFFLLFEEKRNTHVNVSSYLIGYPKRYNRLFIDLINNKIEINWKWH